MPLTNGVRTSQTIGNGCVVEFLSDSAIGFGSISGIDFIASGTPESLQEDINIWICLSNLSSVQNLFSISPLRMLRSISSQHGTFIIVPDIEIFEEGVRSNKLALPTKKKPKGKLVYDGRHRSKVESFTRYNVDIYSSTGPDARRAVKIRNDH